MANQISQQTKAEANKIAKGTQKPGQTKEQTKLISQGIEKGIAEYKKQQKAKAREADKQRKQALKSKQKQAEQVSDMDTEQAAKTISSNRLKQYLPWGLLVLSWLGFAAYIRLN
jgi:hypothetical protein